MDKKSEIFKFIALGAAGMYLYNQYKQNPMMLGSSQDVTNKANNVIDNYCQNKNVHPMFHGMAKAFANEVINEQVNVRDVTPIEENDNG